MSDWIVVLAVALAVGAAAKAGFPNDDHPYKHPPHYAVWTERNEPPKEVRGK